MMNTLHVRLLELEHLNRDFLAQWVFGFDVKNIYILFL